MKLSAAVLLLPLLAFGLVDAFLASKLNQQRQQVTLKQGADENEDMSRRNLLSGAFAASILALSAPNMAMAQEEIPITPFNGLIFNYRNSDVPFGLDASTLGDEPSVPFKEFADRLQKGEVKFVDFQAPFGDVAYVTFKEGDGKPIRIGEGYPIEQHDGWSSPAFVVRAVENQNVPYKFSVPGLEKYRQ
jgi:hypothetical protein